MTNGAVVLAPAIIIGMQAPTAHLAAHGSTARISGAAPMALNPALRRNGPPDRRNSALAPTVLFSKGSKTMTSLMIMNSPAARGRGALGAPARRQAETDSGEPKNDQTGTTENDRSRDKTCRDHKRHICRSHLA